MTNALPQSLFAQLVIAMASAALVELGVVEDPITKKKRSQPAVAKQNIDFIEMLKEKTRGNLSSDEAQLVDHVLTDLKLHYAKNIK